MSSSGITAGPAKEFLDQLDADVEAGLPIGLLEPADRITVADRFERITRKLYFLQLGIVQALEDSKAASQVGAPSVSALLQYRLRLSPAEANA
ncbi:MAG TPA: hypothetical protein VHC49_16395, partial [Mycobacteriales bacterium]|nr:hypothetical protein [Mycobacteriales bacterium]